MTDDHLDGWCGVLACDDGVVVCRKESAVIITVQEIDGEIVVEVEDQKLKMPPGVAGTVARAILRKLREARRK